MTESDLFKWLVKYHCEVNLPEWLKHAKIENERIVPASGYMLIEGFGENKFTKGFLIAAGSGPFIDNLISDRIIVDEEILDGIEPIVWESIPDIEQFFKCLNGAKNLDSSYIFDTKNMQLARFSEFNNSIMLPKKTPFSNYVPKDFLSVDGKVELKKGRLKTKNAIRVAAHYSNHKCYSNASDVHTYQIKATPYGNSGVGKVTHFDKDGLLEEFFLVHNPNVQGPFIIDDFKNEGKPTPFKISGVHRRYRVESEVRRDPKGYLLPTHIYVVDKELNGRPPNSMDNCIIYQCK